MSLLGCATTANGLRKDITPIKYSSTIPSKTLATCIKDEWRNITDNPAILVQLLELPNGYSVTFGAYLTQYNTYDTSHLVDLINTKSGTNILHYDHTIFGGNNAAKLGVIKCLASKNH